MFGVQQADTKSTDRPARKQPAHTPTDEQVIAIANNADNGEKFLRLWEGDTTEYGSPSEGDAALAMMLTFWTRDADQVERLMRQSKLAREKWDREDYLPRTIGKPIPEGERRRPGPKPKPIPEEIVNAVVNMATENPWYGYQRIAVMCRREEQAVKDRQAYQVMKLNDLLQKRRPYKAEVYQASKLYELLPQKPNELWQMDVTYIHIPGYGWQYAITVIDYYSRYLLACYLTSSYSAIEAICALALAREEAERLCGPLEKIPFLVTDNGPSFIARRFGEYIKDLYSHVRIRYRTPTQLGLLERFHKTLKTEEVYTGGRSIEIPRWQSWARGAKEKLDQMLAAGRESASRETTSVKMDWLNELELADALKRPAKKDNAAKEAVEEFFLAY